jgi:ubiquinone/menaquinone biosynthesis C-methylase UbiE
MKKSYQKELLDQENIPEADLIQNLKELDFINTWLGGHEVIKKGFYYFQSAKKPLSVLEIGSGGGDNLRALNEKYPKHQYTGLDLKETCINYSTAKLPKINWLKADYREYKFEQPIDVIFNSLFCHHFDDNALVEMLIWMNKNAKVGFFIGDLHRHWLAYFSIKFLTKMFSKSYLVKNDAPLSVKRSFTKKELKNLLEKANVKNYKIVWCWAFRWLIVVKK